MTKTLTRVDLGPKKIEKNDVHQDNHQFYVNLVLYIKAIGLRKRQIPMS